MTRASVCRLKILLTSSLALFVACPDGAPGTSATETSTTTTTSTPDATDSASTTSENVTDSPTGVPTGTSTTGATDADTTSQPPDSGTTSEGTSEPTTAEPESTTSSTSTTDGVCRDPGPEPNDVEEQAFMLPAQQCLSESEDFFGVLEGADVDWFTYHAVLACDLDLMHAQVNLSAEPDLRLCMYVACDVGPVELECFNEAPADSPNGAAGCCDQSSHLSLAFACPQGEDSSAQLFIRVDTAALDACVEYSGTAGFFWRG